jgi:hypothetical protein
VGEWTLCIILCTEKGIILLFSVRKPVWKGGGRGDLYTLLSFFKNFTCMAIPIYFIGFHIFQRRGNLVAYFAHLIYPQREGWGGSGMGVRKVYN